jgi:hypothetical protein
VFMEWMDLLDGKALVNTLSKEVTALVISLHLSRRRDNCIVHKRCD